MERERERAREREVVSGGGEGLKLAQLRKQQIKKPFDALSSSTKGGNHCAMGAAPAADTLKLPISLLSSLLPRLQTNQVQAPPPHKQQQHLQ